MLCFFFFFFFAAWDSSCWFPFPDNKPNKALFHTLHRVSQVESSMFFCKLILNSVLSPYFLSLVIGFQISRCVAAKGDDAPECDKFAKFYRSLCPSEWVYILISFLHLSWDFFTRCHENYLLVCVCVCVCRLIGGTSKERMELSLVLFKTDLPLLLSAEFQ